MKEKLIEVKNLTKQYIIDKNPITVVNNVNLDIYENEMVAIMGKSGAGKSTLLNILACIDKPTSGKYIFNTIDMSVLKEKSLAKIRSTDIGIIFQNFNLIPDYTILDNVKLSLLYKSHHLKAKINSDEIALKFLDIVGLKDKVNKYPSQLSGGEQQRVAIARTLAIDPKLILADEPTGALDNKNTKHILDILKDINSLGKTIIIVTHDENVGCLCDRIIYMEDGSIVNA